MPILGPVNVMIFVVLFVVTLASRVVEENSFSNPPSSHATLQSEYAESGQFRSRRLTADAPNAGGFMAKAAAMHAMPSTAAFSSSSLGQDIASTFRQAPKSFDAAAVDRMLVWTGHIDLAVAHGVPDVWDTLQRQVKTLVNTTSSDGYIESESEHSQERYVPHDCRHAADNTTAPCPPGNYGRTVLLRSWSLSWRLPSPLFASSIEATAALVKHLPNVSWVKDKSASATDITEQFIDTKSRESMLATTYDTLEKVLVQATTTAEVMDVMRELQKVAETLEHTRQTAAYLSKSASLSTLRIGMDEAVPSGLVVMVDEPLEEEAAVPWSPAASVARAFRWLLKILEWSIDALIVAVVVGVPIAAGASAMAVAVRYVALARGSKDSYDRVE
ncbi:hypothetical protein B5M09_008751 [Aphanomyces astaci]|nr:hypothetical protein B5M09_008751 [Aphanomyces astaci]